MVSFLLFIYCLCQSLQNILSEKSSGIISVVFLVTNYPTGTGVLRGKMFAEYLNKMKTLRDPLGRHISIKSELLFTEKLELQIPDRSYQNIDICIIVKHIVSKTIEWCRQRKAYIYYDVLDNMRMMDFYINSNTRKYAEFAADALYNHNCTYLTTHTTVENCSDYVVDAILTPNEEFRNRLQENNIKGAVLYHQHTNPGIMRHETCISDSVRTVGFLVGANVNLPSKKIITQIRRSLCLTGIERFLLLSQQLRVNNKVKWMHRYYECGRRGSKKRACTVDTSFNTMSPSTMKRIKSETEKEFENNQIQFHVGKALDKVDLGIVWPAEYSNGSLHRPTTRLFYWMSHGVPCVFYPYEAYVEVSKKMGYVFPRNSSMHGKVPTAASISGLTEMVSALVNEVEARLHFRNIGLQISAKYRTSDVALHLAHILIADAVERETN